MENGESCEICQTTSEDEYPFVKYSRECNLGQFISVACFECFKDTLFDSYTYNHRPIHIRETQVRVQRDSTLFAHWMFFHITAFIPSPEDPRFRMEFDGETRCTYSIVSRMFDNDDFARFLERYESWPEEFKFSAYSLQDPFTWIDFILESSKTNDLIHKFFEDAIQKYYLNSIWEEIEFVRESYFADEEYYASDPPSAFDSIPIEILDEEQLGGTCAICLEEFEDGELVKVLHCKHMFHADELDKWGEKSNRCPYCRSGRS